MSEQQLVLIAYAFRSTGKQIYVIGDKAVGEGFHHRPCHIGSFIRCAKET